MKNQNFAGDKKMPMTTLLAKYERKFIDKNVSKVPSWLEGYHLTLMTIPFSIGLIIFGYLAKNNIHWLWASSLMLLLQWFTDCFDGALGRFRDTGIPKWGFYMDHFLDFVFMCALLIGYSFLLQDFNQKLIFLLIPVFGCFMTSSFLSFAATNEFKITFLTVGPTEIRIAFVVLNCLLIFFGTAWIEKILLYILISSIVSLCVIVFRTQKYIWSVDMKDKQQKQQS